MIITHTFEGKILTVMDEGFDSDKKWLKVSLGRIHKESGEVLECEELDITLDELIPIVLAFDIGRQRKTKCEYCGLEKLDVVYRPNWYARDVGNSPEAMHTVCDECDKQNNHDI